jgi:hypothetical protein
VPVFLISFKAGGTRLNVTAADTVIGYDPWWTRRPSVGNRPDYRIGETQRVFSLQVPRRRDSRKEDRRIAEAEGATFRSDLLGEGDRLFAPLES